MGKLKPVELDPEATKKEAIMGNIVLLIRACGVGCGVGIIVVGVFVVSAIGTNFAGASFEISLGVLLGGAFEVLFGLLIIATEMRLRCVARYFGFMALHLGKCAFMTFCGAMLCSLAKAALGEGALGIFALVVGISCLVIGAVHLLAALPFCPLPRDPLRQELIDTATARRHAGKGASAKNKKGAEVDMGRIEEGGGDGGGGGGSASGPWWSRGGGSVVGAPSEAETESGGGYVKPGWATGQSSADRAAADGGAAGGIGSSQGGVSGKVKGKSAKKTGAPSGGGNSDEFKSVFGGAPSSAKVNAAREDGGRGSRAPEPTVAASGASSGASSGAGATDNPFCGNRHLATTQEM